MKRKLSSENQSLEIAIEEKNEEITKKEYSKTDEEKYAEKIQKYHSALREVQQAFQDGEFQTNSERIKEIDQKILKIHSNKMVWFVINLIEKEISFLECLLILSYLILLLLFFSNYFLEIGKIFV